MWQNGWIPIKLGWTILVLTPKVKTYTQGIGLLENLRKEV